MICANRSSYNRLYNPNDERRPHLYTSRMRVNGGDWQVHCCWCMKVKP